MNSDKNNFRFGRLKANGSRGFVQTETLSGEVHSSVRNPQPHGFESLPPVGSETYSVYQGGNPDNGAVLTVAGQAPVTLSEGESVVYSSAGATVYCKEDGSIAIDAVSEVTLNGDTFGGLIKINDLTAKVNALIAELRAHYHILSGVGNTTTPATTFTDLSASDYENGDVNHG
jgi:phage gp45-like